MKAIVAGLGACVYDTLIRCAAYPEEDKKVRADGVFRSGGGPVGNALVVMSKLGLPVKVLGAFAKDEAADFLLSDFQKYGVATDEVKRLDGTRSFTSYILLSERGKTRTCVFDQGTVPDEASSVRLSALQGIRVLHLDGNYLHAALRCAKYCRENGVKVSLDAGGLYPDIEKLLPFVDILIPSRDFACQFTGKEEIGEAMLALDRAYHPEVLAVTDGENGGYYLENGRAEKFNGIKVEAVDTNGAGDTFHGAFLVAYLAGKHVRECAAYAAAVAAYKCMHFGARDYELSQERIRTFLLEGKNKRR